MAARWLIAALCFAKVLAVLGEDCTSFKNCDDCANMAYSCKWCESKISIKTPGSATAVVTAFPTAAACRFECTDVSFGTLGTLFNFTYGDDGEVSFAVEIEHGVCPADDVADGPADHADCDSCLGAEKVWCPLTFDRDGFDARTGGICQPEGTTCGDVAIPELEGLSVGEGVTECPTEAPAATTAAPGAAAVVPHGGKLLLAALAASVTGVLL